MATLCDVLGKEYWYRLYRKVLQRRWYCHLPLKSKGDLKKKKKISNPREVTQI